MNIALWLERTAALQGDSPAVVSGTDPVASYAQFHARAGALAQALTRDGMAPGDRVAAFMTNCPEYLVVFYAIWMAGGAIVPINAKLHPREAAWIVENSGARIGFASPSLLAGLQAETDLRLVDVRSARFLQMTTGDPVACCACAPGDLAWLFYTSGTTGRPKGVCITHGMLAAVSLSYLADVDPVTADDAALYAAPMSHGAGLYAPIHVRMGARHVCPVSGGFDAGEVLDLSRKIGGTSMFMAPTMIRRLTDTARQTRARGEGIKTIVYGGGPMYVADIVEAVDRFGPKFVQIYGQGECPMAITALSRETVASRDGSRWRARLGSVGRAQSMVEVAVGDGAGRPLPAGEPGEIMVRGQPVMPGYWQNPEATARALRDGWLMTGDVGWLDADGYLTLADRSKDVIISGGSNIYPREVEEVLLSHPGVHAVSVVGRKSADWGEDVVAFVVARGPTAPDPSVLDAHCLQNIARFKRPKAYVFVADLPRNNYGKVLKTELRKRLAETR